MHKFVAGLLVLSFAASPAFADVVIYDSTGGIDNGGDPLAMAGPILANEFVNPFASTISFVTLNLIDSSSPSGSFSINVYSVNVDGNNAPGAPVGTIATVDDTTIGSTFSFYTYAASAPINLAAGTSYYLGIEDTGQTSTVTLGNTVDNAVLTRSAVMAGANYYNNGGVQPNSGGPYEMVISVNSVPEPASAWMMLIPMAAIVGVRRRI